MTAVNPDDENKTTVVVDIGIGGPTAIYVDQPVEDVKTALSTGEYIHGDSGIGEVHVEKSVVKYLQRGRREVTRPAPANRPS